MYYTLTTHPAAVHQSPSTGKEYSFLYILLRYITNEINPVISVGLSPNIKIQTEKSKKMFNLFHGQ